jgi:hypothetical protein
MRDRKEREQSQIICRQGDVAETRAERDSLAEGEQGRVQLIRRQALRRFPLSSGAEATAREQDLWYEIFARLTSELLTLRRQENPATLDEASWETIAFACLSPMANALLQEAKAEERAALAREAREGEARLAQREAEKRRLKPLQEVWLWVNQGRRPATVLAVVGRQALLEYVMPRGSTALRLVQVDDPEAMIRSVSYRQVPLAFLRVLVERGVAWIGEPQVGHPVGPPAAFLLRRAHGELPPEGMTPLPWREVERSAEPEPRQARGGDDVSG